jgi:hypothetical protein
MIEDPVANARTRDLRYFRACITVMAVITVLGFVVQVAMGRSSFDAPLVVHVHAGVFMGWVALFVTQAWLAAAGVKGLHRLLGFVALFWAVAVVIMGTLVTIEAVRGVRVAFFFHPQHFLLANPGSVLGFFGLFTAAVLLRRRPDWHPRLQISAFMLIMGAGIGRLLPMPFLKPFAYEIAACVPLTFALFSMVRDQRVHGRVHPAWWWPIGVIVMLLLATRLFAFSPLGDAIYAAATEGSIAAGIDGLAFPAAPPGAP